MTNHRVAGVTLLALALHVTALHAQGNLSTQGFGYPPGQGSTRAHGTGEALAEFDPQSAVNPAALGYWGETGLFFQYDPESRRVTAPNGTARTNTARFPLAATAVQLGKRWTAGLSASTLLDRSWATRTQTTQTIGTEEVLVTETFRVTGAINDIRLGAAWRSGDVLSLGLAVHGITGTNNISVRQAFPDPTRFTDVSQTSNIEYGGTAVSAGVQWRPSRLFQLAASARKGGNITARSGDTVLSRGRVPDRVGAALAYEGISGITLAIRAARDSWSSLEPLGQAVTAYDAWDVSGGAEFSGPRLSERVLQMRAGVRHRRLPFAAAGQPVEELSFGGGIGAPLARERATLDVSLQHANRSAEGSVQERAWILSVGLRLRP